MMPLRVFLRLAAFSLVFPALAGCSALGSIGSAATPLDTFELSPLPATSASATRARGYLEVALPTATGALSSDRIIIKPTPLEVQALPDARWVNETTELVQMLLVRSAAGAGRFALVSGAGTGWTPDYLLITDLMAFQAEVKADGVTVVIDMTLTLMNATDGTVVASRRFSNSVVVPDSLTTTVVAAFDQAMTQQLEDAVGWISRNAGT